jgi:glycerophosphoryl diester phosphodiesterase
MAYFVSSHDEPHGIREAAGVPLVVALAAGVIAAWPVVSDPALLRAIGGVSVFQGLVDMNLVTWVHQHKLLILAWTVNDSQRFNQLVRLGVDGITTANLAILRALEKEP